VKCVITAIADFSCLLIFYGFSQSRTVTEAGSICENGKREQGRFGLPIMQMAYVQWI